MPASWTDLDSDPATGDGIDAAILELEQRTLELGNLYVGSSAPADPAKQRLWLDTSVVPHVLKVYANIDGGAAWNAVGPVTRLSASINADPSTTDTRAAPHEFKALRVENRASLPTVAAGNAGMLVYKTGDGEIYAADQPISAAWKGLLSVVQNASYDTVDLSLDGSLGNDGTNPPTAAAKGVAAGWLFDATNEKRTFALVVPKNWNGASDLKLRLWQVLDEDETASDVIEWTGEVRSLAAASDKAGKSATTIADSSTSVGSDTDGIAEGGGPHLSVLVIDHDDATNPVSIGALLLVTVWRKTVGGSGRAAGTVVVRAELAYIQKPRHERA